MYEGGTEEELTRLYKGLGRVTRNRVSQTGGKVKVGKAPLRFKHSDQFAKSLLMSAENVDVFGHTFLLFCWKLICRSANGVGICLAHLEWRQDALCVWFSHTKCDQVGSKEKDPMHIYANVVK